MITHVVIGANYGDEGKGLITDFLTQKHKAADVTRFNGGSQAGHTVVRGGVRNVFNMYSSGTLLGAQTRIAAPCIINFGALRGEYLSLEQKGCYVPQMKISPRARVSTPYESWLNQEAELARGVNRHGSCGYGINETVVRDSIFPMRFESLGLDDRAIDSLYATLDRISKVHVPTRARELGIKKVLSKQDIDLINGEFMLAFTQFYDQFIHEQDTNTFWETGDHCVYEGAQGLGLDQELGLFPHLTRSNTGLINAVVDSSARHYKHYKASEIPEVRAYYVTRPYLTRHGNGPLEHEMSDEQVLCGAKVDDPTNAPNPWQGTIRYAPLNLKELARRIYADLGRVSAQRFPVGLINLKPSIVLTCMDQVTKVLVVPNDGDAPRAVGTHDLARMITEIVRLPISFISTGPSAKDVREAAL